MKAAVVCKPGSEDVAENVMDFLKNSGIEVVFELDPPKCGFGDDCKYDFIVTVGGDGTILRTLQKLKKCPPIFGVNTGKVGLLTHATPENFREKLGKAVKSMKIDEFMRIQCKCDDLNFESYELIALNEIALLTAMPARLVEFSIRVDGIEIERLRSDGLLISTPVGSTAYALSTGGPVIDPEMECMLIVPVAPFKLGWKPWVISKRRKLEVEIISRKCLAIADGHTTVSLDAGTVINFKKSNYPARFFKIDNRIEKIVKLLKNIK